MEEIFLLFPELQEMNLIEQVDFIVRKVIRYQHEYQYRLLVSYIFIPSSICSVLPHLICQGPSGSGKSAVPKLISEFYGYQVFQGATTTVALRNEINSKRWIEGVERNFHLLWDDIDITILKRDNSLLSILKSSYSRKTECVSISGGSGINITFRTFCPKVISTIHQFWNIPEFIELKRRILILLHQKIDASDLLDIDYLSFSGINSAKFELFWNPEREALLKKATSKWLRKLKPFQEQGKVLSELFAISDVLGLKPEVSWIEQYLKHLQDNESLNLSQLIKQLVKSGGFFRKKPGLMALGAVEYLDDKYKIIDEKKLLEKLGRIKASGGIEFNPTDFRQCLSQIALYEPFSESWIYEE